MMIFQVVLVLICLRWTDAQDTRLPPSPEVSKHPKDSLFLSYPEIKLFAGYSLDLVKTRCTKLNAEHLFQFQKYVTTRSTPSTHQVTHKKQAFASLLDSLRKCNSRTFQLKDPETLSASTMKWIQPIRNQLETFWIIFKGVLDPILDGIARGISKSKIVRDSKVLAADDTKKNKIDLKTKVEQDRLAGRARFEKFVNLLSKFYKRACNAPQDMQQLFEGASKDFLGYVSADASTTVRKAGEYFLNDALIKNITECISEM